MKEYGDRPAAALNERDFSERRLRKSSAVMMCARIHAAGSRARLSSAGAAGRDRVNIMRLCIIFMICGLVTWARVTSSRAMVKLSGSSAHPLSA
jgi:hypothetical protein